VKYSNNSNLLAAIPDGVLNEIPKKCEKGQVPHLKRAH